MFKEVKTALGDIKLSSYTPVTGGNITADLTLKEAFKSVETVLAAINGDENTTGSIAA